MKNYKILLIVLMTISFNAFSQEGEEQINLNKKKHELRLDAIEAIAIPAIEVSYEYVINKYSGAGISVNIALDSDDGIDQNFAITPFYRQYFFNKKDYGARGFFAEGLLQFATGEDSSVLDFGDGSDRPVIINEEWSQFGIGFSIGQKWVSRNGFVIELSIGAGRYFGDDTIVSAPEAFFRGGIHIGYRF